MTDTGGTDTQAPQRRSRWTIPLVVAGIVVLAAAGGLYLFFSGDAPPEVDLAATAEAVTQASSTTAAPQDSGPTTAAPQDSTTTEAPAAGIDGAWTVDTSVGEFTVTEATTASFVGFRVDEELSSIGATTAVGRTPNVSGSISIDGTVVTSVEVTADMTAIVSDRSRRDGAIQRALNTGANPNATFVLSEPIDLGDEALNGDLVATTASGQLTVNGISNQITIDIEAQLVGDAILITGTTDVVFSDYDVSVPAAPVVLSVEDNGIIELQLWMAR